MTTEVIFQDDFSTDGQLDPTRWDYNHWSEQNNPSYLGLTQMRQSLPFAQNGMARIRLDTWNDDGYGGGKSFWGSEAITIASFVPTPDYGIAFEAKLKFEGSQCGMIAGFFTYQYFPPRENRDIHDEIDFEILTSSINNADHYSISTNIYKQQSGQQPANPLSIRVPYGTLTDWHIYRMEWFLGMTGVPDQVSWFLDGKGIRQITDTNKVPTKPQQLHLNLWGVPKDWGPSPGDPGGPNIGCPSLTPAQRKSDNQTYFFDVTAVKVERVTSPR